MLQQCSLSQSSVFQKFISPSLTGGLASTGPVRSIEGTGRDWLVVAVFCASKNTSVVH